MYDIAIIGTGPAGISAAITAKIRNKHILLLGSRNLSDKVRKAHRIENYPGLPGISGSDLADRLQAHLDALGIEITEKRVSAVYALGDHFSIQAGEEFPEARAVIIAGGVVPGKPLPGEETFLGRGVSYCATCDGRLYAGQTVAVIGSSADAADEAEYLTEVTDRVLYFPLGPQPLPKESEKLTILRERPLEIRGGMKANALATDQAEHPIACVFILRDALSPETLVPGVETDGPHIKVNLQMETNLPGLFACGDIAGKPYQYIKAAGQGNTAALSAVAYLSTLRK